MGDASTSNDVPDTPETVSAESLKNLVRKAYERGWQDARNYPNTEPPELKLTVTELSEGNIVVEMERL